MTTAIKKKAEFKIDREFKSLIPVLSNEERTQLEENIIADGCREPIVVWKEQGTIVDGHNRYAICLKHGLGFGTKYKSFPDRASVAIWIILNQLGRRNLTDFSRAELALKLKDVLAAQAAKRMVSGQKTDPVANLPQGRTRDEIGELAGVSGRQVSKVGRVLDHGTDDLIDAARAGEVSPHAAAEASESLDAVQNALARGEITPADRRAIDAKPRGEQLRELANRQKLNADQPVSVSSNGKAKNAGKKRGPKKEKTASIEEIAPQIVAAFRGLARKLGSLKVFAVATLNETWVEKLCKHIHKEHDDPTGFRSHILTVAKASNEFAKHVRPWSGGHGEA
jgi:uncharacterized protein YerC